jgi:hypothetical protein
MQIQNGKNFGTVVMFRTRDWSVFCHYEVISLHVRSAVERYFVEDGWFWKIILSICGIVTFLGVFLLEGLIHGR